jgi:hypothetical protein
VDAPWLGFCAPPPRLPPAAGQQDQGRQLTANPIRLARRSLGTQWPPYLPPLLLPAPPPHAAATATFFVNGAEGGGVRERAMGSPAHPLTHRGAWLRRAGRGSSAPPLGRAAEDRANQSPPYIFLEAASIGSPLGMPCSGKMMPPQYLRPAAQQRRGAAVPLRPCEWAWAGTGNRGAGGARGAGVCGCENLRNLRNLRNLIIMLAKPVLSATGPSLCASVLVCVRYHITAGASKPKATRPPPTTSRLHWPVHFAPHSPAEPPTHSSAPRGPAVGLWCAVWRVAVAEWRGTRHVNSKHASTLPLGAPRGHVHLTSRSPKGTPPPSTQHAARNTQHV